jgi:hypothetical protein
MAPGHESISQEPARHDAPSASASTNPNAASAAPPSAAPADHGHDQGAGASRGAPAHPLKSYALTAALALVFGMIGAYANLHFLEKPTVPSDSTGADQAAGSAEAGPTTRDLSDQVTKLSDRVEAVTKRIDALPKPTPPPDLTELQVRAADVTKLTEEMGPIREAVKRIDDRLEGMSRTIRSLGNEVHSIPGRAGAVKPTSSGTDRHESLNLMPAPERPVDDEALAQGATLFHQQKYKEALDLFNKLGQTNPDDARVWYYAALAHGFATKQWRDDGTGSLVEKGIARERAGTPPRPVIDETFKGLTSATGKDWLATYRKRVGTR